MTTVGFYVKAGIGTGYGHIVRCLALADELKRQGARCSFETNEEGMYRVVASRHAVSWDNITSPGGFPTDVWVLDLEDGIPFWIAEYFRPLCKTLVILNGVGYPDGDPGRLLADLVFYQGVTDRPATLNWTGFSGRWFVGPEYLILRDEFRQLPVRVGHNKPRAVIAGGGSDPKDVTYKSVFSLITTDLDLRVIAGPAYKRELPESIEIVKDPPGMAESLAWADVAVISYGMTAFECLALGVPTVALSISPDHKASADLVQQQSGGALLSLGEVDDVTPEQIRLAVYSQLARQATLSKQARAFVDGQGAERVAGLILESKE